MLIKKWKPNTVLPIEPIHGDAGAICFINGFKMLCEDGMYEHTVLKLMLRPLERTKIQLGFATVIPDGYYCQIVSLNKSDNWKGLSVINSPNIINSKYRDEWRVIVMNISDKPILMEVGDKICKFILHRTIDITFEEVTEFP